MMMNDFCLKNDGWFYPIRKTEKMENKLMQLRERKEIEKSYLRQEKYRPEHRNIKILEPTSSLNI